MAKKAYVKKTKKTIKKKYGKKTYKSKMNNTIQIATRRKKSDVLKFVKNLTYQINPNIKADGSQHMFFLQLRANSIWDMVNNYYPQQSIHGGLWQEQDNEYALVGTGEDVTFSADGFAQWEDRYSSFTVLGSKITVTFEPILNASSAASPAPPTTLFLQKSYEEDNGIDPNSSNSGNLNKLPYMRRAQLLTARVGRMGKGGIVTSSFSAKKGFAVVDIMDNKELSGTFGEPPDLEIKPPQKQAYYNIYLAETVKRNDESSVDAVAMPRGILRIQVEYITKLTDPTQTNQVRPPAGRV